MEIKINKVVKDPEMTPEVLFALWRQIGCMSIREMSQSYKIYVDIEPLNEESKENGNY